MIYSCLSLNLPYAPSSTTATVTTRYSHSHLDSVVACIQKNVSSLLFRGLLSFVYCVRLYLHLHPPTASCLTIFFPFVQFVIGLWLYGLAWTVASRSLGSSRTVGDCNICNNDSFYLTNALYIFESLSRTISRFKFIWRCGLTYRPKPLAIIPRGNTNSIRA